MGWSKSGNASDSHQKIRLLALALATFLPVVSLDGCNKSHDQQHAPPASTTSAPRDTTPIQVSVTKLTPQAGRVEYRYSVINRSASPIYTLVIGFDEYYGVPKLLAEPIGWGGDTIPRSSYGAPPGWAFEVEPTEEESLLVVRWEKTAQGTAVMRGQSESRFSVTLARADSAYERGGFWGVYLFGEAPRYGVIKWSELSDR